MDLPMILNEQQKAALAAWLADPSTPEHFKRAAEANDGIAETIERIKLRFGGAQ